ncbi:tyrosine kinase receptor Cad96Ca [Anabrus simplex]|uniref:tyrosine kinase receptor Cad96Ca n=1 Tax=Anabrus simplex TaxID=316456 RepID=UPI0035A2A280
MDGISWTCFWSVILLLWIKGSAQYSDNSPPVIWIPERSWEIMDSEPVGSEVTRVHGDDSDGDQVIYGIEQKNNHFDGVNTKAIDLPFSIDPYSGRITINDSLADRIGDRYSFYVTGFDGKLTVKQEVWATVKNSSAKSNSGGPGGREHQPDLRHSFPPQPGGGGGPPRPPPSFSLPAVFRRKPPTPTQQQHELSPAGPSTAVTILLTPVTGAPDNGTALTNLLSSSTVPFPATSTVSTSANAVTNDPAIATSTPVVRPVLPVNATDGAVASVTVITTTVIPIAAVCGLFLVGGGIIWLFRRRLCRTRSKNNKDDMRKEPSGGIVLEEPMALQHWRGPRAPSNRYEPWETDVIQQPAQDPMNTKPKDRWEFPRHRLKVFNILGEGCFGQVWRCEALDIDGVQGTTVVAVKTLKENATEKERQDLVQELQVMKMLEPHANVVRLLGCCTDKDPLFVIMEFVPHGKLQSFLRNSRAERCYGNLHGPSNTLTSRDLTSFVYQVARGMEFLSSKGIIHRDLAARNILVGKDHVCKVADFGFARDVITSHVYERKSEGRLPIRWMAPESLYDNIFSVKSDVWSFGVLMWEVVTLGSTPYPGLPAAEVMKRVRDGYRLDKPEHCRRELYNIMYYCWDKDPKERPTFQELVTLLEQLLLTETDYIELERFPDHSYYNMVSLSGEKL